MTSLEGDGYSAKFARGGFTTPVRTCRERQSKDFAALIVTTDRPTSLFDNDF
jgi:hypothetical protein